MEKTENKIVDWNQAKSIVEYWKNNGLNVVFTNGCFDILHLGHVDYLEKAKSLGDKLVVAINSDLSVSSIKGSSRPITPQLSRMRVIASMQFVDLVVLFSEETPLEVIKFLVPDILVKGKDYEISNIIGAELVLAHGGEVKTIDLVEGFSTTKIINKIINNT